MSGIILDSHAGVVTTMHEDPTTGDQTFHVKQDVEGIVNGNKRGQNSGHDGYNKDRSMRHYAEVPFAIVHKWMMEDNMPPRSYFQMSKADKEKYIHRKMKDPDYAYLKAFWQNPVHSGVMVRHAKAG